MWKIHFICNITRSSWWQVYLIVKIEWVLSGIKLIKLYGLHILIIWGHLSMIISGFFKKNKIKNHVFHAKPSEHVDVHQLWQKFYTILPSVWTAMKIIVKWRKSVTHSYYIIYETRALKNQQILIADWKETKPFSQLKSVILLLPTQKCNFNLLLISVVVK